MLEGKPIQERDPRKVPSKTRNPIIADMFDRMNYMERRGSGFKKILDEYEAQDKYDEKLQPIFYSDCGDFKLTLWNLTYSTLEIHQVNHQDIHQDNHQLPTEVSEKNILLYCSEPKSMLQLAEHFNYKDRSYFRRKYIVPLIKENKLFMTQPEKPNSREQKYYSK